MKMLRVNPKNFTLSCLCLIVPCLDQITRLRPDNQPKTDSSNLEQIYYCSCKESEFGLHGEYLVIITPSEPCISRGKLNPLAQSRAVTHHPSSPEDPVCNRTPSLGSKYQLQVGCFLFVQIAYWNWILFHGLFAISSGELHLHCANTISEELWVFFSHAFHLQLLHLTTQGKVQDWGEAFNSLISRFLR